ncbi:MAG: hypothetical protein ACREI8_03185, partial [Myxococcota bacterium]
MASRFTLAFLVFAALTLSPGFAVAQDEAPSLEESMIEMPDTAAQHAALAKYYREKAAEARKLASRHTGMGRAYLGGKSGNKQAFSS